MLRTHSKLWATPALGGDLGLTGTESFGGPPGGEDCFFWDYDKKFYLYDNGMLVATFDEDDNIDEMFINGPGGKLAVYDKNLDANLYYFLNDRLGSSRGMMVANSGGSPQLTQYTNYHPYGLVSEQAGSYLTGFQYTGKEHDQHSSFDFQYYGARYYDPAHGIFTSVDAAGEFASGYVYCGGNPMSLVDPDGNSVVGTLILGFKLFAGYQAARVILPVIGDLIKGDMSDEALNGLMGFIEGQMVTAFITGGLIGPGVGGQLGVSAWNHRNDRNPLKGMLKDFGTNMAIKAAYGLAGKIDQATYERNMRRQRTEAIGRHTAGNMIRERFRQYLAQRARINRESEAAPKVASLFGAFLPPIGISPGHQGAAVGVAEAGHNIIAGINNTLGVNEVPSFESAFGNTDYIRQMNQIDGFDTGRSFGKYSTYTAGGVAGVYYAGMYIASYVGSTLSFSMYQ